MSYYKPKRKNNWLRVVGIVLVVVLCLSIFGVFKTDDDIGEDYTRVRPSWTVGGIVDSSYDDSVANSILSDLIPVNDGLKIVADLDSNLNYKIYLYDENSGLIAMHQGGRIFSGNYEATSEQLQNGATNPELENIPIVKYVRIELCGLDDYNINFFDKIKYTNHLTIYTLKTAE